MDRIYMGFTLIFGIIWTSATAFLTFIALSKFSLFFVVWLPIGYGVTFVILRMLLLSRRPQTLEATANSLIVHGTGIFFAGSVSIPREQKIKIGLGRYGGQHNGEIVHSLNIFSEAPWWKSRISISPFSHPSEKIQIFHDLQTFLTDNGFDVETEDAYPRDKKANPKDRFGR